MAKECYLKIWIHFCHLHQWEIFCHFDTLRYWAKTTRNLVTVLTFKYFTIFGTFKIKTRLYLLFAILTQGCIIRLPMDRPAKVSVTKRTLKDWDFVKKYFLSWENKSWANCKPWIINIDENTAFSKLSSANLRGLRENSKHKIRAYSWPQRQTKGSCIFNGILDCSKL